ncbi:helix-turn-helix domain-containing protein [Streptomyces sp. DG2A-72]|uniref:helix-turn-helix domain-containing protein n=1 Tax=Streptomyces sp. DG2A-72 TaxID=3051386 RepID=UPI00265C1222|nr:helix-turn-helix domain-containing protein [Streptomyces sp. DG2A-72]MDO0935729.1 helix-turn-helix domain-containing protein [Streptomyces sp. DG2A-72]
MKQSPSTPLPRPAERRRLREAQSLTQAQVAARMGVSRETVRSWETGRTTPRGRKREAYAKLLAELPTEKNEQDGKNEKDEKDEKDEKKVTAGQDPAPVATDPTDPTDTPVRTAAPPRLTPQPAIDLRSDALTPAQAFDALYAFCAPALVRQTYLLTGRRELARESVERAFQLAWQSWPEVALDRDPAGWVRATAYECALSPWHRLRPRYRHPEPPPADATDRALMDVLLKLPPPHRRTLLLYDGVGLDLPDTAAETEASTPATANRLLHARAAIAERLPELSDPAELHRRLATLASTERLRAAKPLTVRHGSERRARFWTRAAIAFTVALIGTTALTLRSAPTQYEPPVAPGSDVRGVPKRVAPGPLSEAESELREKLREETARGPQRLLPTLP